MDPSPPTPLSVDTRSGLLPGVPYHRSPHQDERPDGAEPELVILHGISLPPGEFGGAWVHQLFTGTLDVDAHPYFATIPSLELSTHLLIRRDGALAQYVPFGMRAWHAGRSCFQGREACNDFSIGIELEGTDEAPYEAAQYQQLAAVLAALLRAYPALSADRIVGHCDVAPGRKTDPGPGFDWARMSADLEGALAADARDVQARSGAQGDAPGDGGTA